MQLYFAPLACSMATRISLYEAGAAATFTEVDTKTKRTLDGQDYRQVNPLGLVPAIRTDDGVILTENAAVLQYVADEYPQAKLAPADRRGRARLQAWLCFIGTELHKGVFTPLLDKHAPQGAKEYALEKSASRLGMVEQHLSQQEWLLDQFSVADAYLVTVLGWTIATPIDLKNWKALSSYFRRERERPSVARAFAEERPLYAQELARHAAA